ncbi:MAG: MFS transporter [Paucibacter sp.]|nr:MFS transporter [Roseateles sp.]
MVAMNIATLSLDERTQSRRDYGTISLIGLAHGTSHFFHLLLVPLFPALQAEFGYSFAELGLLVTTFFLISGIGQAMSGFVVDRFGARPVLFLALGCFVLASIAAGTAQGFAGLMLAAALAGLGNCPFHPIDFTILNKRVSQPRLGHAFSVHGITGNLGWAFAPVFSIGIWHATGHWRWAYFGTAVLALAVMAVLAWRRDLVDDKQGAWHKPADAPKDEHPMAFLKLPSVWLCFSFFFWSTMALTAIQSFASPALQQMYGLPLSLTAYVVTGYMLCGAAGMLVGGFLVHRIERLEKTIAAAMVLAALLLLITASGLLPGLVAATLAALAGFGTGIAGPSRDMLIKRAAPPGATGRVYGTVYSGLDAGFALGAPVFGLMMDRGQPSLVFAGSALTLLMGVASAAMVGMGIMRRRALQSAA